MFTFRKMTKGTKTMPRPTCGWCHAPKNILNTANSETWICCNCDQYPWMIQSMTEQEVMDQDAKASKIAREDR